jgi:rubrerythrin/ferredoxin
MAVVTFRSPLLPRDITVYAVAGHRGTVLALARAHKIPIPFDCQDGGCGSCLIEVKHLAPERPLGIALTEKEKEMLRQLGKITKAEVVDAEVNDLPPRNRLACQCFIRNEDILVSFEGDQTLPAKGPALSIASRSFTGGIKINTIPQLFAYAVKVEEDAALHFESLSAEMSACGNGEVAALFAQLARYSRLHLATAQARAGTLADDEVLPAAHVWPDYQTPERSALWAGDPSLSRLDALKAALIGEKRGYEFYYSVAGTTNDPEVSAAAKEFYLEEAEHVKILEQWIGLETQAVAARASASAK